MECCIHLECYEELFTRFEHLKVAKYVRFSEAAVNCLSFGSDLWLQLICIVGTVDLTLFTEAEE